MIHASKRCPGQPSLFQFLSQNTTYGTEADMRYLLQHNVVMIRHHHAVITKLISCNGIMCIQQQTLYNHIDNYLKWEVNVMEFPWDARFVSSFMGCLCSNIKKMERFRSDMSIDYPEYRTNHTIAAYLNLVVFPRRYGFTWYFV